MTQGYTPTDSDVKSDYVRAFCSARDTSKWAKNSADGERAFNRWLAAHDAQIRESARHLLLKDGEITAFAKTMFEALGTYGLFACEHDDWREAFDDAFVNAENGRYGLNAVEAGIKAINAKREEA